MAAEVEAAFYLWTFEKEVLGRVELEYFNTSSAHTAVSQLSDVRTDFHFHEVYMIVSVLHCCKTNYYKCSSLQQHTLSHSFCGSGVQHSFLGSFALGLKGHNRGVSQAVILPAGSSEGVSTSRLIQAVGRNYCCRPQSSVSYWLLASAPGGCL